MHLMSRTSTVGRHAVRLRQRRIKHLWLRQRKAGETRLYLGIACPSNEAVESVCAARSLRAAPTKAGLLTGSTSPVGTTRPTSQTSMATDLSSYTKHGMDETTGAARRRVTPPLPA